MVLEYESALAYNKSSISNSKYKEMNEKLTNNWAEIKKKLQHFIMKYTVE